MLRVVLYEPCFMKIGSVGNYVVQKLCQGFITFGLVRVFYLVGSGTTGGRRCRRRRRTAIEYTFGRKARMKGSS